MILDLQKIFIVGLIALVLTNLAQASESRQVRVRIQKVVGKFKLAGTQLAVGVSPTQAMPVRFSIGSQLEVGRIKSKRFGLWKIRRQGEKHAQTLIGDRLFVEGESLQINGKAVPQTLQLVAEENGDVDVVASLDLEKYLTGVLPSEMPATWPIEALKAQVIASRSYALALMLDRRNQNFDVESSILDQVFDLENHRQISKAQQIKINQVIRGTANHILVNGRGQVVKAFYHADCGGQTEAARQVWGDRIFEGGTTKDESCPLSPWGRWEYGASIDELTAKLAPLLGTIGDSKVVDVKVLDHAPSGRVGHLEVMFMNGLKAQVLAHDFRRMLGYSNLKSTNFSLRLQDDFLMVQGKGNGHGVGLCQFGTRKLAQQGQSFREILKHYYPTAQIKVLRQRNILVARNLRDAG